MYEYGGYKYVESIKIKCRNMEDINIWRISRMCRNMESINIRRISRYDVEIWSI